MILVDDGSLGDYGSNGSICDEYAETDRRIHVIHQRSAEINWITMRLLLIRPRLLCKV